MVENAIILVISLVAIAISADRFVLGAARTAELLKIQPLVVGVIVIGFGTGLPELMTAIVASLHHNATLGISSVMGSTVVNSTLVLGTLGIISAPKISSSVLRNEGLFQFFSVLLFGLVIFFGHNRITYAILLIALVVFVFTTLRKKQSGDNIEFESETRKIEESNNWNLPKAIIYTLAGLILVLICAELLINSASSIAINFGISKAEVGITLVALGTSLPEWVTAIAAARRGHSDLVIGNIFGANIFNATAVASVAGLIAPGILSISHLSYDIIFLVTASAIAWLFLASQRRLSKAEGWLLIAIYLSWIFVVSI